MDENAVREEVRKLIVRLAPVRGVDMTASSELSVDLGYDSLRLMELATELEDHFELREIPEDDAAEADTVGEVEELVLRLLAAGRVGSQI
ncbi:MAG TPA: acyl carrier protein [Solirubrobacterales bacterium]|nr:acyl carrier protein [Solirubrobacterales bacterium]